MNHGTKREKKTKKEEKKESRNAHWGLWRKKELCYKQKGPAGKQSGVTKTKTHEKL